MPKYRNDKNRTLPQKITFVIPHGGPDGESSSTVTRVEFNAGDNIRFVKAQMRATLAALGLNRVQTRQYIKEAFNNFEDF
jgi:hypothetical protein